ncbi:alkaline phosphatase family protein [Nitrospira sp. Kam-Ns4a]
MLLVLEGVDRAAFASGLAPTLSHLAKEGAVTWLATAVRPLGRLPTMASLLTGLPVEQHGIDWDVFDFIRGYPRPPTLFDYLDLSGGRDSAVFLMDESLNQLAKPTPYTDYQVCGALRPECSPATVVRYIREYFRKATSGHGYGHAIEALPHCLLVHLPEPGRVGKAYGWTSREYREALRAVDGATGAVLDLYRELGLLVRTVVFVTALSGAGGTDAEPPSAGGTSLPRVPWIAWGAGIKAGYTIKEPVSIMDTGATVLRALGLETYTEWKSHVVEDIFQAPRAAQGDHAP